MSKLTDKYEELEKKEQEALIGLLADIAKSAINSARAKREQANKINMEATKLEKLVFEILEIEDSKVTKEVLATYRKKLAELGGFNTGGILQATQAVAAAGLIRNHAGYVNGLSNMNSTSNCVSNS